MCVCLNMYHFRPKTIFPVTTYRPIEDMDKVSALFSEVWHAGQPLLNQDDILCDFFKKQSEELALAATQSFISVGPGPLLSALFLFLNCSI